MPLKEAAAQLARSGIKGALQKRAFASVLKGFDEFRQHSTMSATSVRQAEALHMEALVARVFAQLPEAAFDSATDMLLEYVKSELMDQKLTLSSTSSTSSTSPTTSFLSLSMQVLFMLFDWRRRSPRIWKWPSWRKITCRRKGLTSAEPRVVNEILDGSTAAAAAPTQAVVHPLEQFQPPLVVLLSTPHSPRRRTRTFSAV